MKKYHFQIFIYCFLVLFSACQTLSKDQEKMLFFVGEQLDNNLERLNRLAENKLDKIKRFQYDLYTLEEKSYVSQNIKEAEKMISKTREIMSILDTLRKNIATDFHIQMKQDNWSNWFGIQKDTWQILNEAKVTKKVEEMKQKMDILLQLYAKINASKKWNLSLESPLKNPSNLSFEDYHLKNVPPVVALNGITAIQILMAEQKNKYMELLFEEFNKTMPQINKFKTPQVYIENPKTTYKVGDTYQPHVYMYNTPRQKSTNWIKVNGQNLTVNEQGVATFPLTANLLGKNYMDIAININTRGRDSIFTRRYWYEVVK